MEIRFDRSRHFDMPKLFYFTANNTTVGSLNTFNYRISPKEDKLKASIWYGLMCSELAEMVAENEFPMDTEGYKEMIYWVDEQYDLYAAKLKKGEVLPRRTFEERD